MLKNDVLNEKYINQLDEMTKFFKYDLDNTRRVILMRKENIEFDYTTGLSIIIFFMTFTNFIFLLYIDASSNKPLLKAILLILIIIILTAICTLIINKNITTKRMNEDYAKAAGRSFTIISFLNYLKILQYEVNLTPLIYTIKKRCSSRTSIDKSNLKEYFMNTWYEEILNDMTNIDKEIHDKEEK